MARSTSSRSKKAIAKDAEAIYKWGFQSSKPRAGQNRFTIYEVRMEEDGSLRCDCAGWIFKKKGKDRACKHTRMIEDEAKEFFKKYKKGEPLPTVVPTDEQLARLGGHGEATTTAEGASVIGGYGRIIDV